MSPYDHTRLHEEPKSAYVDGLYVVPRFRTAPTQAALLAGLLNALRVQGAERAHLVCSSTAMLPPRIIEQAGFRLVAPHA